MSERKRINRRAAESAQHSHADRGDDLYQTPPEAVRALMAVERLPAIIWEPACGPGSIVRELRQAGHRVVASDLIDYGQCDGAVAPLDFLRVDCAEPEGATCILTNPPYRHAAEFVRRARSLCPLVIMLLRVQFLEGVGRTDILEGGDLRVVHIFRDRLPMMHREGWTGPRSTSRMAFAWFVWDRAYSGPPTINRLSWKDHGPCIEHQPASSDGPSPSSRRP